MPKDNEVDEKVMPVAWIVTNGGESCEPWLEYEQSEVDALPAVCIAEPLYSAATVAELRAEVERARIAGIDACDKLTALWQKDIDRAADAERRVGELEAFVTAVRTECFDYYNEGIRPWPHHMQTLAWKADEVLKHATLTGADPT